MNLNVAPCADLRQAALYVPWALLQNNEFNAATDSRKAYNDFDDHVKDLQRAASAAAAVQKAAEDANTTVPPAQLAQSAQQIQQAFILMSASMDGFLQTIPTKYNPSRQQAAEAQQQKKVEEAAAAAAAAGGAGAGQ